MKKETEEKLTRISAKAPILKTKNGMIELDPKNPQHREWYEEVDWEQEEKFTEEFMGISNEALRIEFENGSVIEGVQSGDSLRSKGWFIGIDLANVKEIIFIYDKKHKMNLTLNKKYEVLKETDEHYFIINDKGDYWGYFKRFFSL